MSDLLPPMIFISAVVAFVYQFNEIRTAYVMIGNLEKTIYKQNHIIHRLESNFEDHLMASKPHKPLQLQIDDLRKIVIGDAGVITIVESDEPESEDDDDAESEEAVYIPCDTKASKTFKILDPKKDKPIC